MHVLTYYCELILLQNICNCIIYIFAGNNTIMFEDFKMEMTKKFEMTDIGMMSYYFCIEVKQE